MWHNEWQSWANEDIYGPAHSQSQSSWRRKLPLGALGYTSQHPYPIHNRNLPSYARTFPVQPPFRNMHSQPIGPDWRNLDGWGMFLYKFIIFFSMTVFFLSFKLFNFLKFNTQKRKTI